MRRVSRNLLDAFRSREADANRHLDCEIPRCMRLRFVSRILPSDGKMSVTEPPGTFGNRRRNSLHKLAARAKLGEAPNALDGTKKQA